MSFNILSFKPQWKVTVLRGLPVVSDPFIVASSGVVNDIIDNWKKYLKDESVCRFNTVNKQSQEGFKIQVLMPYSLKLEDYSKVAHQFMDELLKGSVKTDWIAEYHEQGKGVYLKIYLMIVKKLKSPKEVIEVYKSDIYMHSEKNCFVKKDSEYAVKRFSKGDVKKKYLKNWSNRIRIFDHPRDEWNKFYDSICRVILKVVRNVSLLRIREKKSLQYLQFKASTDPKYKYIHYYNSNVRYFNDLILQINLEYEKLDNIIYSPAKYYQDLELINRWFNLKRKYERYIRNKSFNYTTGSKKFKFKIHPRMYCDKFKENVEVFINKFHDDLNKFVSEYICDIPELMNN